MRPRLSRSVAEVMTAPCEGLITAFTNVPPLDDSAFTAYVRRQDQAEIWNVRAMERTLSPSGFALLGLEFVSGGPYSERPEAR